ncbi:mpn domain protein [Plakobranchus ocellatus]|uniref:Mpn domain protein n=1 Tax=Plakobranchus ocellatus TaxID=259542 RepID=A0AAV4B138_9GAST|nr:mpn domain protein [Plakobranchus ocellatus]
MESGKNQAPPKEEEDEEMDEEEDSEASSSNEDEESVKKAVQAITCRKVTLNMLMDDGIIDAGESVLTIDYLGQKFEADLLPNGKIKWQGSQEEFTTPSAWALHCKKLVNPIKRSGCGWASVKYKNKKLDIWKSIWARKQRLSSSSKSPQISPGLRISSSSSSLTDPARYSPGLASPTGPKRMLSTSGTAATGLSSPPLISTTAASTTDSSLGNTNATCTSSQSLTPSSSVTTAGLSSDTNTSTRSSTAENLPPVKNSETATVSEPQLTQQPTGNTKEMMVAEEESTKKSDVTVASSEKSVNESQQGPRDQSKSPGGSADQPPSNISTQSSPAASVAKDTVSHSSPKKAKLDDSFSVTLSQELPSPTPGPLPPRAILQQPVRPGHREPGQDRQQGEQTWDSYQQHQQQQSHNKRRSSVLYSTLGQRGLDVDPFTLIKCEHFDSLSKIQPFTVSVTSNTFLLMLESWFHQIMDIVPERIRPLVEKTERRFAALHEWQDIECFLDTVLDLDFISPALSSLGIRAYRSPIPRHSAQVPDFHCHLTKSEVVGYLGGRWDCQKQHLSIEQAFPAKCRLGDKDRSSIVEEEIRRSMRQKEMMVVGWYHSHPTCPPDPSLRDLDCQMAYQLRMRGSGAIYLPCVGFILSPFEKFPPKQDSKIQAYWVMPNLEHPTSFNIPMHVTYSVVRDLSLTEDLLSDLASSVCLN